MRDMLAGWLAPSISSAAPSGSLLGLWFFSEAGFGGSHCPSKGAAPVEPLKVSAGLSTFLLLIFWGPKEQL